MKVNAGHRQILKRFPVLVTVFRTLTAGIDATLPMMAAVPDYA